MTQLNERQLDPAVALAALDEAAPREPHRQFALKHEDCFVVADTYGDIRGTGDGLFRDDTRVLSRFRLFVGDSMPSLLGASLSQDNILFTANLTNLPLTAPDGSANAAGRRAYRAHALPVGEPHVRAHRLLQLFGPGNRRCLLRLDFAADFRDMFEVRGTTRIRRGRDYEAEAGVDSVAFRYDGLDDVARQSVISFSRAPDRLLAVPRRIRHRGRQTRPPSSSSSRSGTDRMPAKPRTLPRGRCPGALRDARQAPAAAPPSTARGASSTTG